MDLGTESSPRTPHYQGPKNILAAGERRCLIYHCGEQEAGIHDCDLYTNNQTDPFPLSVSI